MKGDQPATDDRVTLAIITRRRPESLTRLIDRLRDPELRADLCLVERILIIDNDDQESAREVAAGGIAAGLPIDYVLHPQRGLARARNAAVALARTPWLAFLDDDESPERGWLSELLTTAQLTGASIVGGPVLAEFVTDAPSWAKAGGFFDHTREVKNRSPVDVAGAGNLLVHRRLLETMGPLFDPSFDRLGGEDSHFCHRARSLGFEVIWATDSVVREYVPASRVRPAFLYKRAFRIGCVQTIRDLALLPPDRSRPLLRVLRVRTGVREAGRGLADYRRAVGSRAAVPRLEAGERTAHGLGMAMGALGVKFRHY